LAANDELIRAIHSADIEGLRKLLRENPALAGSRDTAGVSALMQAVYRRQSGAIDLLRQAGLKLDIFETAALGDTKALAALVADDPSQINSYSADGFTALHFAGFFSQPSAARLLLEQGADYAAVAKNASQVMPLHSAAAGRNLASVHDLLTRGAPVNARQQHGWTALHSAAQNGDLEMVDLLLKHGADPSIKNCDGMTALDLARKQGHADTDHRLALAESA
jgi:uncharacterized protein